MVFEKKCFIHNLHPLFKYCNINFRHFKSLALKALRKNKKRILINHLNFFESTVIKEACWIKMSKAREGRWGTNLKRTYVIIFSQMMSKLSLLILCILFQCDTLLWQPFSLLRVQEEKFSATTDVKFGTSIHWIGTWTEGCCRWCPWSHQLRSRKLYTTVAVTPAPVWVPTQWSLVPSFMSVVGEAKNFSSCLNIYSLIQCKIIYHHL